MVEWIIVPPGSASGAFDPAIYDEAVFEVDGWLTVTPDTATWTAAHPPAVTWN